MCTPRTIFPPGTTFSFEPSAGRVAGSEGVPVAVRSLSSLWILGLVLSFALTAQAREIVPFLIKNSDYRTNLGINNLSSLEAEVSVSLFVNNGTQTGAGLIKVPAFGYVQVG